MREQWIAERSDGGEAGRGSAVDLAEQQTRPLSPTVFIGLGGTGMKTLARLRRRLHDRYGTADYWPIYAFLGVDSHKGDLATGGVEGLSGKPIPEMDRINIGMREEDVAAVLDGLKVDYRHMAKWLTPTVHMMSHHDFTDGAGQIRNVGRLLFLYHINRLKERIVKACERVTTHLAIQEAQKKGASAGAFESPDVDVVIISSLAGGTGSGAFLDCAYLMRALGSTGKVRLGEVRGYLVLPDVFRNDLQTDVQRETVYANGYAALAEMEYFNDPKRHPFPHQDWGDILPIQRNITAAAFDVCYLFSSNNGAALVEAKEVYDLVSDALAFAIGGSNLAAAIRGSWAQARKVYVTRKSGYEYLASTPEEGGPVGGNSNGHGDGHRYIAYARNWSTRFSSLGIASVTMKLPELRRLAAVRLLRRMIQREIGQRPESEAQLIKEAEQAVSTLIVRREFISDLERSVEAAVENAAANSTTADQAERAAKDALKELVNGSTAVDLGKESTIEFVERLVTQSRESAVEAARALVDRTTDSWNYEAIRALLDKVIERIENKRKRQPDPLPEKPATPKALLQWHDLEKYAGSDLFGLKARAAEHIRRNYRTWLKGEAAKFLGHLNGSLQQGYLRALSETLKRRADEILHDINELRGWDDELGRMQKDLAATFASQRNEVLTQHLVTLAGEADLDREIDQAVAAQAGDAEDLSSARRMVLEEVFRDLRLGTPEKSFLNTKRVTATSRPRILQDLVDFVVKMLLVKLPRTQDVFKAIEQRKLNVRGELLPKVMQRAQAYWHANPGSSRLMDRLDYVRFFGSVESAEAPAVHEEVKQILESHHWKHHAAQQDEGQTTQGDLVLANEVHGYALPSLQTVAEMRQAYRLKERQAMASECHIDHRLMGQLPDLTPANSEEATEQIKAGEEAFLSIVLGLFKWSPETQSYQYDPRKAAPYNLGQTYESAARWLRTADAAEYRDALRTRISRWFIDLAQSASREQPERQQAVIASARVLLTLDVMLELLANKCFPPERSNNTDLYWPASTMVRRIRHAWVLRYLDAACQDAPMAVDREGIANECRRDLHNRVRFVGPEPGKDAQAEEIARFRDKRILALAKPHNEGRQVLEEAWRMGWFPEVSLPTQLTNLFPEWSGQGFDDELPSARDFVR